MSRFLQQRLINTAFAEVTTNVSFNRTSGYDTVTGVTLTTGASKLVIEADIAAYMVSAGYAYLGVFIDAVLIRTGLIDFNSTAGAQRYGCCRISAVADVARGTHTVVLGVSVTSGSNPIYILPLGSAAPSPAGTPAGVQHASIYMEEVGRDITS